MTGRGDLGHCDCLLGNEDIEQPAYLHQLVFNLRHRNVKRRQEERIVDVLFHGAPLNPFLRPDLVELVRPRAPSSSSYSEKNSVSPATLVVWLRRASYVASAVAVFCLRRAEWCVAAATAWAIDCCSCRQAARSRRPFRRWAAPVLGCQLGSISQQR